ncbi:hypothetical protein TSUD_192900 [Trifolium subterraneum]|uniref:Protein kinase domain-containing protein n=1 Tax=Trifolium subterraneum TaxID=3900 RepID=A0A2Z6PJ61_TRISU|nr:hypothetical protein TSUD_192900 [Trifolium subterraneum]
MGCVFVKQGVSVTPAIDHSVDSERNNSVKKKNKKSVESFGVTWSEVGESGRTSLNGETGSLSFRLGNLSKYVEGEQAAAGWPAWITSVAAEAIQGWVPLRSDAFEKLDKIGQGTYSSVFRAKEIETGKIVALKKVRFDNFEPESVRFMAREILILRRLDHPNIIKLEGLITSRLSCSIYLVFEYMEHDVTGLLSKPEINFTESQVADFGLANFCNYGNKQQLTSRVVTLWYRPPELLLGSTDYGSSVDIWSVGCVFAELLVGKPILKGRTEYFKTKPYACDPSSLPVYPPSKEIDAKHEEETKRKKIGGRVGGPESRRPSRKPSRPNKLPLAQDLKSQIQTTQKIDDRSIHILKEENTNICDEASKPSNGKAEDASDMKNASQADVPFHGPLQVSKSSGFAWAKRRKDDTNSIRSHTRSISKGHIFNSLETSTINSREVSDDNRNNENKEDFGERTSSRGRDLFEISKLVMQNQWSKFDRPDSFDTSEEYHSQELSMMVYHREDSLSRRSNRSYQDQGEKVEFSGPLISQMHTVDELLERHERHIRHTVRRSWFHKGM